MNNVLLLIVLLASAAVAQIRYRGHTTNNSELKR